MGSNLEDKAYELIKQKILNYEMYPNQMVSDYSLSNELNMSRTPIKHALLKLESDGLIEKSSKSSSFRVAEITTDTIRELFDFREAIETSAYTLAWKNSNFGCMKSELRKYTECMQVAIGNSSQKEHFYYDQCFHNTLVACSKNKYLISTYDSISLHLVRMRFLSFLNPVLQDKACQKHTRILDAIDTGNYEEGLVALREHISSSRDDYISLFGKGLSPNSLNLLQYFVLENDTKNGDRS